MQVQDRRADRTLPGGLCKIAVALCGNRAVFREDVWCDYYNSRSTNLQVLCMVQRWDVDLLSARCVAVSLKQFERFGSLVSSTSVEFPVDLPFVLVSAVRNVAVACCAWSAF